MRPTFFFFAFAFASAFTIASSARAEDAPPPARYIYWVDVRRALLGTFEGKKVAHELDEERARTDAELSAIEATLAEKQRAVREHPTKAMLAEYEKKATELEAALLSAETRLIELETKRVQPIADDVRSVIAGLNEASKDTRILEIDRHAPINMPEECNATEWLLQRLEKPGKKPLAKYPACSIRFFLYVDVDRLKLEMNSTSEMQHAMEDLRDERLAEIGPTLSATVTPLTRFELYLRYTEEEKLRRERERKSEASMTGMATELIAKTAKPLKGVLFLAAPRADGGGGGGGAKLTPSCDVTKWVIELEHGTQVLEDVARECKCVWMNRDGTKVRIARGCGG